MHARKYLADLYKGATDKDENYLVEVLSLHPEKIEQVKEMDSSVRWEKDTVDGWYIVNSGKYWRFFFQERGAEVWGHTFPTEAHAIAWAYRENWL